MLRPGVFLVWKDYKISTLCVPPWRVIQSHWQTVWRRSSELNCPDLYVSSFSSVSLSPPSLSPSLWLSTDEFKFLWHIKEECAEPGLLQYGWWERPERPQTTMECHYARLNFQTDNLEFQLGNSARAISISKVIESLHLTLWLSLVIEASIWGAAGLGSIPDYTKPKTLNTIPPLTH